MTEPCLQLRMSEWQVYSPVDTPILSGLFLDGADTSRIAATLTESQLLNITELKTGLRIESRSHVGRIRLGKLDITIEPKIKGVELLRLLRYAYGLRRLKLSSEVEHLVDELGIAELLVIQLNAEVRELLKRGLLRTYVAVRDRLSTPRGRIDVGQIARDGGLKGAVLPCQFYPRIEDTLLNRILLSGVHLGRSLVNSIQLRRECSTLMSQLNGQVTLQRLNRTLLKKAEAALSRLSEAYRPALQVIRLLLEFRGVLLQGEPHRQLLPGFLFDMNAFFQALMHRFLKDELPDFEVRDELRLKGMIRFDPEFNPLSKVAAAPRPDFVLFKDGEVQAILDAKYRDLWQKQLPREMLYQLVIYAISNRSLLKSCILYPTTDSAASEARIEVTDPVNESHLAKVCLRPVHLPTLVELILGKSVGITGERRSYAMKLAFGQDA